MSILLGTNFPNMVYRGKVRDTYDLSPDKFLLIATDRVSAFDSVLPTGIPDKGLVLNLLSAFWFEKTKHLVPNHMVQVVKDAQMLNSYKEDQGTADFPAYLKDRSMIVRKAERIDIECVVRGYISGSAWAEYSQYGTISGEPAPTGLRESEKLPQPLFTPTTKEEEHDRPITFQEMADMIGSGLAKQLMDTSLKVYQFAEEYARDKGIIIADTKMEFGMIDGELHLIDELLTPDSSRFWDMDEYTPGGPQPSFDKQPLRDWLVDSAGWNKEPPAPELPPEIVEQAAERYREAYRRLTGQEMTNI
ncbi:MAG: phosphoribosylaminoimidazolesuccinocarboxamide synthase [Dehalococcoidia bacterium]